MHIIDTLVQTGAQSLALLVAGIIVYGMTRLLRFRYRAWPFANVRSAAGWGLGALALGWAVVSILFFARAAWEGPQQVVAGQRVYGSNDVIGQVVIALAAFGPAVVVMRWRREPWASARVGRHNLGKSLLVGGLLSLLIVAASTFGVEGGSGQAVTRLGSNHLWALLHYAIVGFSEEFAFRGLLQTRLASWLGRWWGWLLAAVLMALAHVVQRMTVWGLSPLEALLSSASLIPISLFQGYVLLRTENLVAPGLAHTFVNWVGTLG
jgi:membrane protease YdiL (CAAX protease family)